MSKVSGSRKRPEPLRPCFARPAPLKGAPFCAGFAREEASPFRTDSPDTGEVARSARRGAVGKRSDARRGFDGPSQYRPPQKLPPCRGRACPARGLPVAARTPSITARTPSTTGPDMSGPYRPITQKAPAQPRAGAFLYHGLEFLRFLLCKEGTPVPPQLTPSRPDTRGAQRHTPRPDDPASTSRRPGVRCSPRPGRSSTPPACGRAGRAGTACS